MALLNETISDWRSVELNRNWIALYLYARMADVAGEREKLCFLLATLAFRGAPLSALQTLAAIAMRADKFQGINPP